MNLLRLNHYNITAPMELLEQVRDFYIDVMGLIEGERPGFRRRGYWLYADQKHRSI